MRTTNLRFSSFYTRAAGPLSLRRRSACAALSLAALLVAQVLFAAAASAANPGRLIVQPAVKLERNIAGAPVCKKTFISPKYEIDKVYRSMKGPQSAAKVTVGEPENGEELLSI